MTLSEVRLPEFVTSIESSSFRGWPILRLVTVTGPVTSVDDYTFHVCIKIASFSFPHRLESIGMYAFQACSILKSLIVPGLVMKIGGGAFASCVSLLSFLYCGFGPVAESPVSGVDVFDR